MEIKAQPEVTPAGGGVQQLSRSDRIVLGLAAAGLLGAALLGNPAASARPWPIGSILQGIVWAVCLGYRLPTIHGVEVKTLLVSVISGVLLSWATLRMLRGRLRPPADPPEPGTSNQRVSAATLSLFAVLLLIAWGLASTLWSRDATMALGSVWVLSLGWVWAAGLALHGHRRLVRPLTDVMLAAASVTAVLSLWHWYARASGYQHLFGNPWLVVPIDRQPWPLGNPLSLGSVMVPTVLIGGGRLIETIARWGNRTNRGRTIAWTALYAAISGLTLVTLLATGSRGPVLAVLVGAAAATWVAASRERRVALSLAGVMLVALVAPSGIEWLFNAGGGRDASARMRVYAWRDALQLALNKPAAGQGAGAYSLLSTGMSATDCVMDPLAMSGQVSSHAHCEPLELLADLGVFGAVVGLAAWGFAVGAAAGRARGEDRWVAAATAGAIVAVLVDVSSGVSWRLPGPAPFLALPAAMAWMLWRDSAAPAEPLRHRRAWTALIPAMAGLAVVAAGILDFAAARCLYRGQMARREAEHLFLASSRTSGARAQPQRVRAIACASYAVGEVDLAARWQIDPPRRAVAQLAAGQIRASLAYLPLPPQETSADSAGAEQVLAAGLAILQRLAAIAPGYADTDWRIAELQNTRASLAGQGHDDARGTPDRRQALTTALQYLGIRPLDRERIWQSFRIWPEIPPAQRLSLLRGTMREEGEVWRQDRPATSAYLRWSQQQAYLARLWQQLGAEAGSVHTTFVEVGYSALRVPYRQWQDPLAAEGVRVAAVRLVVAGEPDRAADALDLANLLYERAGGLLPYSQAALGLDLAACRLRQGTEQAAWATAALAQARQLLGGLPDNPVRRQLLELADALQQGIAVAAGTYRGDSPEPWQVAVDLFWDMPASLWPADIQGWAERADAGMTGQGKTGGVALQLLIARGDAAAARAQLEQMLGQGGTRTAVEGALRQAGYRWPGRQGIVTALLQQVGSTQN